MTLASTASRARGRPQLTQELAADPLLLCAMSGSASDVSRDTSFVLRERLPPGRSRGRFATSALLTPRLRVGVCSL